MNQLIRSNTGLVPFRYKYEYLPSTHRRRLGTTVPNKSGPGNQRRKRSINSINRPVTLKDRLRTRTPKPQKFIADDDLIAERVFTRLEWARETITSFWKNTGPASLQEKRPPRYELKMDANWWFWNLLLAASPSFVIFGYCELVAKPQMEKQAQEQGGMVPPPTLSLVDSFSLIIDWLQGRTIPSETNSVVEAKQESPVAQSVELETLKELRRKLETLESDILARQPSRINDSSKSEVSPMQQRFLDRQQLQEASVQENMNTVIPTQSSTADTRQFGSSHLWAMCVQLAKSTYEKSKKVIFSKEEEQEESDESEQ